MTEHFLLHKLGPEGLYSQHQDEPELACHLLVHSNPTEGCSVPKQSRRWKKKADKIVRTWYLTALKLAELGT